jgi:beta-glucosidase
VYVSPVAGGWEAPKRLAGWKKVELQAGASETVEVRVDPRLLGVFTEADKTWRIAPGKYKVMLGQSSADLALETSIELPERKLPVRPRS